MSELKNIFVILATFATLYLGSMVVPERIVCSDWIHALAVTAICISGEWLVNTVCSVVFMGVFVLLGKQLGQRNIVASIESVMGTIMYLFTFVLCTCCIPLVLVISTKLISGFEIHGISTYAVITVLLLFFSNGIFNRTGNYILDKSRNGGLQDGGKDIFNL